MSFQQWREYIHLGLMRPSNKTAPARIHRAPSDLTKLPKSVDWVTDGAVTPVKDQGQCGSCWSFSTTGALEGAFKRKYGNLVSLSEQNLVDCDDTWHGGEDHGCNGGLMDNAFNFIEKNGGICSEADYPYVSGTTMKEGKCQQRSCTKVIGTAPTSFTDVEANSEAALMSAVAQQPVSIAIEADQQDFQVRNLIQQIFHSES
jgi:C1A family cysteine protease